jgi:drug/metabolite transporter (DMT)-like permease
MTKAPSSPARVGLLLLALGVVSVGAAAILVRLADAPPLTAAFIRLSVGGLLLSAAAWMRGGRNSEGRRRWHVSSPAHLSLAGAFLALHFALWIASLSATTVTASVVLVCLQPVFVAGLAKIFLRETVTPRTAVGIAISLAGAWMVAADGDRDGTATLYGNGLALGGAVAIALYVLVMRSQRDDVLVCSAWVTSTAALALVPACLWSGQPLLPAGVAQGGWLFLLAVGPQVVGHTALNAALQRLPAAMVSGGILGEPLIASALAFLVLGESPGAFTVLGGLVTLWGLWTLVSRASFAAPVPDPGAQS